jgi:hypothetical protein
MASLHAWVLERQGYWRHEFNTLRRQLLIDLDARAGTPAGAGAGTNVDVGHDSDSRPAIGQTADP